MMALRRFNRDRVAGLLLLVLGLAIVSQGRTYRFGSLTGMGPGFVPVVLGSLLGLTGIAIWLTAEADDFGDAATTPTAWRGWLCILGSIAAFVVLGDHGGLVPAAFVSVFIATLGDRTNRVRDALVLATVITSVGVLLFVYGLKMTFPMFRWT